MDFLKLVEFETNLCLKSIKSFFTLTGFHLQPSDCLNISRALARSDSTTECGFFSASGQLLACQTAADISSSVQTVLHDHKPDALLTFSSVSLPDKQ